MNHEVLELSHKIWEAYIQKDSTLIRKTAYENCLYVHMGVTLDREGEIDAIETNRIVYSNVAVEDSEVRIFGSTAIVTNKLRLTAVVDGKEVVNPFVVTEVFLHEESWKMASLAYTRIIY